jgi:hypothetical protein
MNYKAHESAVQKKKAQIADCQARLVSTEASLNGSEQELDSLYESLKTENVAGRPGEPILLKMQRVGIQQTDTNALIAGLTEHIEKLKAELEFEDQARRDKFATETTTWLAKEIRAHDEEVRALAARKNRLLASNALLRDEGLSEVYRSVLGDACEFIPMWGVSPIKGFDRSKHLSGAHGLFVGSDVLAQVLGEITQKK